MSNAVLLLVLALALLIVADSVLGVRYGTTLAQELFGADPRDRRVRIVEAVVWTSISLLILVYALWSRAG